MLPFMRVSFVLLVALLIVLVLAPAARAQPLTPAPVRPSAVHSPIAINGDAGFTAGNGVTGGSGTPANPYVISGWELNASAAAGLDVENTSAWLEIRGLDIRGMPGFTAYPGIRLRNVTNVLVESTNVSGTAAGVQIVSSSSVSVAGSNLSGSLLGLRAGSTTGLTLQGNTILAAGTAMAEGIDLSRVNDSYLRNNTVVLDTPGQGTNEIHIAASANVNLQGNRVGSASWVPEGGVGLWLDDDQGVTLRGNAFVARGISPTPVAGSGYDRFTPTLTDFVSLSITPDNTVNGLPILYELGVADLLVDGGAYGEVIVAECNGAEVSNLTFGAGQLGIVVVLSRNVAVVGNGFTRVEVGALLWASDAVVWYNNFNQSGVAVAVTDPRVPDVSFDNGYPEGGNYWSGNPGADNCSGVRQDYCPDSDGLADAPRPLSPFVWDHYPRMAPVNLSNRWPRAVLTQDTIVADILTGFTFDASNSFDTTPGNASLEVRWDFNGDGIWDTGWSTTMAVRHGYGSPGFYDVVLEVRDSGGLLSLTDRVVLVEFFHQWDVFVPILGAVAGTLAVNYAVNRYLRKRRQKRIVRRWSGDGKEPEGKPPASPPSEPRPPEPPEGT